MYQKIAVPLDGSPLAESALPFAVRIASLLKAELLLITVAELPPSLELISALEPDSIIDKQPYLKEIKRRLTSGTQEPQLLPEQVETLVVYGRKPDEIAQIAEMEKVDLLVMSTHGRGGLARLLMGSVAVSVIHHSPMPVVLVKPAALTQNKPGKSAEPVSLGRRIGPVIVTLDGTARAEVALTPASELARSLGATIHLLEVIPPLIPEERTEFGAAFISGEGDPEKELEQIKKEAHRYLNRIQENLLEQGFDCVMRLREGEAAPTIVEYANQMQALMVVMATHSRGRIGQILLGSVAEKVLRHCPGPVMMVRIGSHTHHRTPVEGEHVTARKL